MLKMGIVGMANVGKSSTFNLISKQSVPAENFPFCTIDPNHAIVKVPDARFDYLVNIFKPKSVKPSVLSITDIAGLVRGASEGFGLGNEFLGHIQGVDGLYQVVRAFTNDKILHTEGEMDPIRDLDIISQELVAKDLQFVSKRLQELSRKIPRYEASKNSSQEAQDNIVLHQALQKTEKLLENKKWAKVGSFTNQEQIQLDRIQLLTNKPSVYLVNLSQGDFNKHKQGQDFQFKKEIEKWIGQQQLIYYSVEGGTDQTVLDKIINAGYDLLGLQRFFTVGTDEVRSWIIKKNIKAPQAAAVIHTDFEKNFISAEVLSFEKFKALGDKAKDVYERRFSKEGKDYVVKDGDIVHFNLKKMK